MARAPRRARSAGLVLLAVLLTACGAGPSAREPLCGPNGTLRVGLIDPREGLASATTQPFSDKEIEGLRTLLVQASRCEVMLEPVSSSERARTRLASRQWDAAFLPPGLMAFALQQPAGYSPLRVLGGRQTSRSSILVLDSSRLRSLADLNGASIGLLPRGSLTGFYLPLYNLHGITLGRVTFALSYAELLQLLEAGKVDAIAWDDSLPAPKATVRALNIDDHTIPMGALALSGELASADYLPFLQSLDNNAAQMPAIIGYAATILPDLKDMQPLKAIVASVESWNMPQEGQPHRVFGNKAAE